MDSLWFDLVIFAVLAGVALTLVRWFLKYKAARSEQRMFRMLEKTGIDSAVLAEGDSEAIMLEVRKRCVKCQAEDLCERWLDGEAEGDSGFCPNAQVFRALASKHKQVVSSPG